MKRLAAAVGVSVLALLAGHAALAGGVTYGVAGTKACLVRKGAQLQSPTTGVLAQLTPAQQAESVVGTLPGGSGPTFLYLAIGHDRANALAVRSVLKKTIVPNRRRRIRGRQRRRTRRGSPSRSSARRPARV